MNVLQLFSLTVFIQRNFVADYLQAKGDLAQKKAISRFEPPSPLAVNYQLKPHMMENLKHV